MNRAVATGIVFFVNLAACNQEMSFVEVKSKAGLDPEQSDEVVSERFDTTPAERG